MIKIIVAKNSGFCFGVKRAIEIAEKLSSPTHHTKNAGVNPIYTNGPIIHNPQVIKHLTKRGIITLKKTEDALRLKKGTLIIRTHGIKKNFTTHISSQVSLVDATCPFVKRAQDIVQKLDAQGRKIIILGDSNHPEVEGLISYAREPMVVKDFSDIKKIHISPDDKIGFLSQTTQSTTIFNKIAKYIKKIKPDALIYDTICRTTSERQKEVESIARKCDIMFIIGGKNSANTKRLAEIAARHTITYHIETLKEIQKKWLDCKKSLLTTGIAAGASTPSWIIQDVIERIKKLSKKIKQAKINTKPKQKEV